MDHGWINDLVTNYGYVIVALLVGIESIGVPVPGETALVAASLFASRGHLNPWGVAAVAVVGAVVGDNIGYAVGRRWGHRLTKMPGWRVSRAGMTKTAYIYLPFPGQFGRVDDSRLGR